MNKFNFTEKQIRDWGGAKTYEDADTNFCKAGKVLRASYNPPVAEADISGPGNSVFHTRFETVQGGNYLKDYTCPCIISQGKGLVCAHIVAAAITLMRRAGGVDRSAAREDELRRARALQQAEAEGKFPNRVVKGGHPFKLRFRVGADWQREYAEDRVHVDCNIVIEGEAKPIALQNAVLRRIPLVWNRPAEAGFDDFALGLLEELCQDLTGEIHLKHHDFIALLKLLSIHGRQLYAEGKSPFNVLREPVESRISVDLDRETGEILVKLDTGIPGADTAGAVSVQHLPYNSPGRLVVPDSNSPGTVRGTQQAIGPVIPTPFYLVFGLENPVGFAFWNGSFYPLAKVLPGPMQQVYRGTITVPRAGILRFLKLELNNLTRNFPNTETFDFKTLEFKPGAPRFSLKVKGSLASVGFTFFAVYQDAKNGVAYSAPAGETGTDPHFCIPDPDDIMAAFVRDHAAEQKALSVLRELGITADSGTRIAPLNEERNVLNFLGSTIPRLERLGYAVEFESGSPVADAYYMFPKLVAQIKVCKSPDPGHFEIGYSFEEAESNRRHKTEIDRDEITKAISSRESFVRTGGATFLFDIHAFESLQNAKGDCDSKLASRAGFTRLHNMHAPYIKAAIDAIEKSGGAYYAQTDAIADWRRAADRQNHIAKPEPVRIEGPLNDILRPYQKEGISWLRFMEGNGLGGILADEMGLGKTVQTLAWLRLKRHNPADEGKPALVVCPTSLLDNWAKEVEMFTPELSVLIMRGLERRDMFDMIPNFNIVVTSYALLRRDVGEYTQHRFSAVILDEAQNIKNRATMNAKSVKALRSDGCRFVLTGTPMENSVADLWSIMDFLMPGYLGDYQEFRVKYELPLSLPVADPERESSIPSADRRKYDDAKEKLRLKLRPFLLRRRKQEVAKDLPPKITQLSWCHLSREQQAVYDRILETTRVEIQGMVRRQGFDKSRMAILTALLRLRQVCCHLSLLGDLNPLPDAKDPSSKLEQFFDLYEELVSDGHRILVFSQFVKMLRIVRAEFDARGVKYCYLDGSSDDRQESVECFNNDHSIPVFLISLKAGGTGLNLAGADTVIHFDPWWNPAVEDQATDRAHRIGQRKTVYCIKLLTAATVEEKVLMMQQRKRAIIGATVESDEQTIAKLTWDDIREILNI